MPNFLYSQAFDRFVQHYALKYPKASDCLANDKDNLLTFFDFPAEHWLPIRTTNPIESVFATIHHRTNQTKGSVSRATLLTLMYKLARSAGQHFYRLKGFERLAEVITGIKQEGDTSHPSTTEFERQQVAA